MEISAAIRDNELSIQNNRNVIIIEGIRDRLRVLRDAITQGGTTLRDFVSPDGRPGYFRQHLRVYDRKGEACQNCGEAIVGIVLGGRGTFYCPVCQPVRGFGRLTC